MHVLALQPARDLRVPNVLCGQSVQSEIFPDQQQVYRVRPYGTEGCIHLIVNNDEMRQIFFESLYGVPANFEEDLRWFLDWLAKLED